MKVSNKFSFRFSVLTFALFLSILTYAQNIPVRGIVLDENRDPMIGATVLVKGTKIGTSTDVDGKFYLKAPSKNSVLIINSLGYSSVELAANSPVLKSGIVLESNTKDLDEVVVIGYGSVKKSDATGSVIAIKPDDFNKGNRVTAQEALVGKIPGVNVVPGDGAPGSGASIRIRSGSSLSASNYPLIVIDGIPVDNSFGGINPEDIESFTVLKDASATAIYGSRASNGVIVMTTKKGTDKLQVTYNSNFSVSSIAKRLTVLNADEFRKFVPTVTGVPSDVKLGDANTDWQDEVLRTGFCTDQNISVSGKLKAITAPYRVSVGYTNQNGIVKTNNYQRVSFGGNINPSFFDNHLTANLNAKVSYEDNHTVSGGIVNEAMSYDPTRPVMTGSPTAATDPGLGYFIWMNGNSPMAIQSNNPVATLDLDKNKSKVVRSIGSAALSYKVHGLEDLKLNVNLGYDVLRNKSSELVPDLAGKMYTSFQKDGTGLDYSSTKDKRNYLLDAFANYDKKIGKNVISAMGGYGWQHFWEKYHSTSNDHQGKTYSASHYETEHYLLSFYGRLNYTFDNRYLVTATLRSDASSRFSKENRWGIFPSAALAWRISEESFLKEQTVLSNLKLRLGYGVTGQQEINNDYPYMTTFSISYPESCYQFGDQWYNTYRPNGYDNDIKWETTTTWNAGIDYGFLNNRISGTIDFYKRYTKDLLNTINVISGTNYAPILTTNIGKMENKGVEFSINTIPVKTRDFEWSLGMNYTWNDSKITKLNVVDSQSNFVQTGSISGTGKYVQVFMVNERPYTYYLAKQAYDDAGQPIEGQYVQPDGSVSKTETRYNTGKSALPSSYLGFNTRLAYKKWELGISGHGSFGNYVYNYVAANQYKQQVYSDQGSFSNILKRTSESGFELQQLYSDYWLEKGSFFRFDNITLGYTFDNLWNKDSKLRITAGVQNVATITSYSGIDPELSSGLDRNVYPRPRNYSLGLNLTF